MIKVHHLNCGTMCPVGGALMDGFSKGFTSTLVCHCLALETPRGIVLVDTGFGRDDIAMPRQRLSPFFLNLNRIQLQEEDTALYQLKHLGFRREDVTDIILTHLDFDHAGGITDFPHAKVHVMAKELYAARNAKSFIDRRRYRLAQWKEESNWVRYVASGEDWFGFDSVRELEGLLSEILLIPLVGHTMGHAGVAIQTERGWLLHAGDAYFYRGEMDPNGYHCTPGLRAYQTMMEVSRERRIRNQKRLRDLVRTHSSEVKVFCAHDAIELKNFVNEELTYEAHSDSALLHPKIAEPHYATR